MKKLLLAASIAGILGTSSVLALNPKLAPVAIIPTHKTDKTEIARENESNDREVSDDRVPAALAEVGEYGEEIYDHAKENRWDKVNKDIASARKAIEQLKKENPTLDTARLTAIVARIEASASQKARIETLQKGNELTLAVARMAATFQPKVPIEVTLLDFYGRELEIWSEAGNLAKLQSTAGGIDRTWKALRPTVLARGGEKEVKIFDGLVDRTRSAKTKEQFDRLASPILDEVDNLEKVFK